MKFIPHDYQKYAIEYIESHPISAVFLDMGLGKTVITLTAIANLMFDSFEIHRILIIGPLRVARDTWTTEADKWDHLQNLICSVAVGAEAERKAALMRKADIYIINRENVQWLIEDSGVPFDYDMVVIDELSSFKNHNTRRFRSLLKVRPKVKRIVGLTGTPASNGLMDLWAEFRILDMGRRLGRFITRYRADYFQPDRRSGQVVYSYKPLPHAEEAIYRQISDVAISMKAVDHLKMPELVSSEYPVRLSEEEKRKYSELKRELTLSLGDAEITAANAASLSGKLSQMANGAIYDDGGGIVQIHDRKLDALEDLIEAANGRPVLVAYWFKHDLARIQKRFLESRVIDTSRDISDWNVGCISMGLLHPASGGHGLNLQEGGSTMIWYGLTWSLELYQQLNARLWRQGQSAGAVVIHHIVAAGTHDEDVMRALERKDVGQAALIAAVKAQMEVSHERKD